MKESPKSIDLDMVLSTCAWCRKSISADEEVFSLGAHVQEGYDLQAFEGRAIELFLPISGKRVYALVPVQDSTARQAGNDMLFMICSESCGKSLRVALEQELDFLGVQ